MDSLASRARHATNAIREYQSAHIVMAQAAGKVVEMVEKGCFTPQEAIEALASFSRQYKAKLARIDERAR